jgi:hypothetical protein
VKYGREGRERREAEEGGRMRDEVYREAERKSKRRRGVVAEKGG